MHTFSMKSLNCLTNTKDLIKIIFCLLNFQKSCKKKMETQLLFMILNKKKKEEKNTEKE